MRGIYLNAASVDSGLIATLDDRHMEKLPIVPKTVMGTVLLSDDSWLRIDANYPSQMTVRFNILAEHNSKVIDRVDTPHVRAAEVELRNTVTSYLLRTYPDYFHKKGKVVSSPLTGVAVDIAEAHPMEAVAALQNTDLLLMLPAQRIGVKERGKPQQRVYRLMSGALVTPNGWSLRSHFTEAEPSVLDTEAHDNWQSNKATSLRAARLGKSVMEIHHGIVPHYDRYFKDPVNRMFNAMAPGKGLWRRNWGLPLTDHLFLHADVEPPVSIPEMTPENLLAHGHIRSEHETFIRLPGSKAIVFGVQTYIWPLREVMSNPLMFNALVTAHANLSPEMREYRKEAMAALDVVLANNPKPLSSAAPL